MTSPVDLPEGFVLDPASTSTSDGEDLTLEGVLREAGCLAPAVRPLTAHEAAVQGFASRIPPISSNGLTALEVGDPLAQVVAWARQFAGREVGQMATWMRLIRVDLQRGALFIVSAPSPTGEVDLLVIANRGMLTRSLLVDAAKWAFFGLGVTRVVARIPVERDDLKGYARRAGFVFEGVAAGYFHGQADASVWSMTARSCRWLSSRPPEPPPGTPIPDPTKVH